MSPAVEAFRHNVRTAVAERKLTLTQMAFELKMGRASLSRIIHGHEGVTLERAEKIANYLGIPLPELIQAIGKRRSSA